MALIGPLLDTGATNGAGLSARINIEVTPAEAELWEIPGGHYINNFTVLVNTPGSEGTRLRIVDQEDDDILPEPGYADLDVQRIQRLAPDIDKAYSALDRQLTAVIEGPEGANPVNIIIIKDIINLSEV
jgi:hypothetical protein